MIDPAQQMNLVLQSVRFNLFTERSGLRAVADDKELETLFAGEICGEEIDQNVKTFLLAKRPTKSIEMSPGRIPSFVRTFSTSSGLTFSTMKSLRSTVFGMMLICRSTPQRRKNSTTFVEDR